MWRRNIKLTSKHLGVIEYPALLKYVKNRRGEPIGVVCALKRGDVISLGWSKVHKQGHWYRSNITLDVWDKKVGVYIAKARALSGKYLTPSHGEVPDSLFDALNAMFDRANRYYK